MNINMAILQDGLVVMCVGFSIVFAFLTVLIFAMIIMSKVVGYLNKIFPVVAGVSAPVKKQASGADEEIAVAIASVMLKMSK